MKFCKKSTPIDIGKYYFLICKRETNITYQYPSEKEDRQMQCTFDLVKKEVSPHTKKNTNKVGDGNNLMM